MIKKILLSWLALSVATFASSDLFLQKFINNNNCDQILTNNGYFETCYDYRAKGAKFVAYMIDGDIVNVRNIKKRPRFYEDKHIPKRYRSTYSDYTHNGLSLDRGHIYEDAAMDYSLRSLKSVYVMSNIFPQDSTINRSAKAWKGLEKLGRNLSMNLGYINVLNGIIYSENPKRIGRNRIAVPKAFWKMYYNKKHNYKRCFYFKNKKITDKNKKIKDYEVDCKELLRNKI